MKRLILVLIAILLLSLVACGKREEPEEPAGSKDIAVDCEQTLVAHQTLLKQHEGLKVFSEGLQAQELEYINIINELNAANFELMAEAVILTVQKEQLADSLEQVLNELLQAGFEGDTQLERLQEEYEKVLARLQRIEPFYPPRDFPSASNLKEWLADDDTDSALSKYATQLMNRALLDGFKMSFYVMGGDEYHQHYKEEMPAGKLHAVNLVIIGNNVYLVDPQNDGVWLKCYLD